MLKKIFFCISLIFFISTIIASTTSSDAKALSNYKKQLVGNQKDVYKERLKKEKNINNNPFGIILYRPTYIMPFYYTGSPDYKSYHDDTPLNQKVKNLEFKGQFSMLAIFSKNFFGTGATLSGAYTQTSYWQLYSKSPYFRETDYMGEIFFSHKVYDLSMLNFGFVHQSNGRGGLEERSWNRVFAEAIIPFGKLTVSLEPWILVFKGASSNVHNPDIAKYFGHVRFYKFTNLTILEIEVSCSNT